MNTLKHKIISTKNTFAVIFVFTIMVFVGVLGSLAVTSVQDVFAAINKQINYQGKLTNNSGAAVADGTYNMEFKLYTVSSGGSPLWTETRTSGDKVQVTNGLFSVLLGEVTSLSGVDFNQTLYLGVNIGGTSTPAWDGEMTPRKKLGAVPAAIVAETLDGLYASQFFRNDTTNATSSTQAFLRLQQSGTGPIAEFIGSASTTSMIILANGNVGIGSSTPGSKLSVNSGGSGNAAVFEDSSWGNRLIVSLQSTSNTNLLAGTGDALSLGADGVKDYLFINTTGEVGIGTSTPSSKLSVAGDINFTGAFRASGNAGTAGMVLQTTGTGVQWVATSSLGISGGSGSPNYLVLENGGLATATSTNYLKAAYFTATSTTATSTFAGGLIAGNGIFTVRTNGGVGINNSGTSLFALNVMATSSLNPVRFADVDGTAVFEITGRVDNSSDLNVIIGDKDNVASGPVFKLDQQFSQFTFLNGEVSMGTTTNAINSQLAVQKDGNVSAQNLSGIYAFGKNVGTGGNATGGYFDASSGDQDAFGVYGTAQAGTGESIGVYGVIDSSVANGAGVRGSGIVGIEGWSNSASGFAGKFAQSNASGYGLHVTGGKNYFQNNVGIGTTTPSSLLSVAGDINFTGAFRASGNAGTAGMVLQTTGTGVQWVATSSLGISGGSGSPNYLVLENGGLATATSTNYLKAAYFTATSTTATSTFAGIVGIGTTTPHWAKLGIQSSGNTTAAGLRVNNFFGNGLISGGPDAFGGHFVSTLSSSASGYSYGVYAEATNTGDPTGSYGLYGFAKGIGLLTGVFGRTDGNGYGLYGYSSSSDASSGALKLEQINSQGFSLYALGGKNYFQNNVGIGTTTPTSKLAVIGDVNVSATTTTAVLNATNFWDNRRFTTLNDLYETRSFGQFTLQDYYLATSTTDLSASIATGISGATYNPTDNTVFMINNNTASLYEFSIDGALLRTITLTNFPDPEAMTWMYDDVYAIGDENTSTITILRIASTTSSLDRLAAGNTSINLSGTITTGTNVGIEGLTYDSDRDVFYVIKEKTTAEIYKVTRAGTATTLFNLTTLLTSVNMTDASDVYFDRNSQDLFITSDEGAAGDRILQVTLQGTLLSQLAAPTGFGQIEGIGFTPTGDTMFLAGENDLYARYEFARGNNLFALKSATSADSGKVGIGTSSPVTTLTVRGSGGFDPFLIASSSNATMLVVSRTGNVGIGTSTPSSLLSVAGDFNLTGAFRASGNAGTAGMVLQTTGTGVQWVATSSLGIVGGGGGGGSGTVNSGLLGQVAFYAGDGTAVSGTSTLFISGEKIGIGTTTPGSLLTVAGTTTTAVLNATRYTDGYRHLTLSQLYRDSAYAKFTQWNARIATTTPHTPSNYYLASASTSFNGLADISGVKYYGKNHTLVFNRNTNGTQRMYETTLDGRLLRTVTLSGFPDPEALDWMYDDWFVIGDENTIGADAGSKITIIQIPDGVTTVTRSSGTVIDLSGTIPIDNSSVEGVAYDHVRDVFYVAEENTGTDANIYQVTRSGVVTTIWNPNTTVMSNLNIGDFSDLYYDHNTEHLFIAVDQCYNQANGGVGCDQVIEIDLQGNVIDRIFAPNGFNQLEGIGFSPDGENMYLAGEVSMFAWYKFQNRSDKLFAYQFASSTPLTLGIGTTTPASTLTIQGAGGVNLFTVASSTGNSLFTIFQNGSVGIGTSTPSAFFAMTSIAGSGDVLNIASSSGSSMLRLSATGALSLNNDPGTLGYVLMSQGTSSAPVWVATSSLGIVGGGGGGSGNSAFTIGNGFIFNATTSDNVGIGTTSPLAKLDVYGDVLVSGANRYLNFGTSTGSGGYGIRDNNGAMEFKNLAGNWQTFSSSTSTSSPNGANGTLQFNNAGSFGGDESLVWDNTNNRLGIGTSSPAEVLHVAGNILVGKRTDTTGVWSLRTQSTPGTFASGGTSAIGTTTAMAVYNGSLYVGTMKAGAAEVYRYNGGTSWTRVSSSTAGVISEDAGATSAINAVSSMAVYNGMLYIGTAKTGAAEVYQYNGNSTWTLISSTTAGAIGGKATTTAIDSVSAMTVHQGQLIIGTSKASQAEVYRYDVNQNVNAQQRWFKLTSANAGTIGATTAVNAVSALLSHNGFLYVGVSKANGADVYRMDAPMPTNTFTRINAAAGSFTSATNIDNLRTLAIFNGALFAGIDDGAGTARVVRWNGNYTAGTVWSTVSSSTAGVIAEDVGSQTGIDRVISMAIYKNDLYVGTADSTGIGQVYKYDGGTTWTIVSSSTAGVIPTTGTGHNSGVSGVTAMAVYNDDLWIGTEEASAAEVYSFNSVEGESNKLKFEAQSDNADGIQNALGNFGEIQFIAEENGRNVAGNMNTGVFVFSHGINTAVGAYDLAEDYPTRDDTLTPGDLVSLDTREKGFVRKAQGRNDRDIIGIYSVDPALRLSQKDSHIDGARAVPIALAGRVPVTVTLENGPIKIGDYLTSSMEPGKAAKANKPGRVIGRALGNYSGAEGEEPKVTVFLGLESIDWNDIQTAQVEVEELNEEGTAGDQNAIIEFVDTVNEAAEGLVFALLNRADNVAVVITNQFTALFASIQELFVRTLAILPGGSFTVPSGENQISGTAIMPAGATDVLIPNEQVDEQSIIYVSPTSAIDAPMFIGRKVAGKGFHVRLKEPFNEDITFDWFFIKTYIPKNKNGNEVNAIVEQENGEGVQNGTTTITVVSPDAGGVSSQADTVPVDEVSSSDSNTNDGAITSEGQAAEPEDADDTSNSDSGESNGGGTVDESDSSSGSAPESASDSAPEPAPVVESAPTPIPEPMPVSEPAPAPTE